MSLELPGSSDELTYSLDSNENNTVTVENTAQGASTAEARFQIYLGEDFDFMTAYNASSTEKFYIHSSISDTTDGFEIFFLSSAFTASPIIDPSDGFDDLGRGGYDPDDGKYDDPLGGGGPGGSAPVPEPATMLLLGSGLPLLAGLRKKIFGSKL
jgi:hypothetical protein